MKYELLPPTDPRVLSSIAPFDINTFKKQEKIELKEFVENMFYWIVHAIYKISECGTIGLLFNFASNALASETMSRAPNLITY